MYKKSLTTTTTKTRMQQKKTTITTTTQLEFMFLCIYILICVNTKIYSIIYFWILFFLKFKKKDINN